MNGGLRAAACAALLSAALGACDERAGPDDAQEAPPATQTAPLDPALAARLPAGATLETAEEGRRLFAVCAVCHGFDAQGTQLGPSLRDAEWIHGSGEVEEIARIIQEGVPEPEEFPVPMPVGGGGDFTEPQVRSLALYVYLLGRGER